MPHVNLHEVDDASALDCEVCIVGTGPAGSTLARELSGSGLRVTLLESGGFDRQAHTDLLNEIQSIGRPRVMDQWQVRNRIVGGSSHTWTGRCAPFDAIDFERREWIPYSGWPFRLESLTSFLDRSAPYLGLGTGTGFNDDGFWRLAGRTPPGNEADPDTLLPFFWQLSRDQVARRDFMRFGRHLLGHLGENVTLVTNATVLHIDTNEFGSQVTSLEIATAGGDSKRIFTSAVILCAGGIENARLLLASDRRMPGGLGNARGLVGRFLMDHPRDTVGHFPHLSRVLQRQFTLHKIKSASGENLYRRGFRLSPVVQRKEALVNCSAFLREVIAPDDPWSAFTRLLNGKGHRRKDSLTIAARPHHFGRSLYKYFLARSGTPHKIRRLELVCMCEQVPDPASRITLSSERDRFGVRVSKIDWRTHEAESRTIRRMAELVAAHFARVGPEAPVLDGWIGKREMFPIHSFPEVAHPMGTTRMADAPEQGVVDRHGEVHGVRGLYVAGSSIFPTGGHCNPTQMIVALAIRLADRVKTRISRHQSPARLRA